MQKSNSSQNLKFPQDDRSEARRPHASSKENFPVLLEVEVSESLFAAVSGEQGDTMCQNQVVEVTIVRPKKEDSFNNSVPSNNRNPNTIDEHKEAKNRIHRRCATRSVTDRRRISRNDKRQHASFFDKKLSHEMNVDQRKLPLVEVGAVQKILEAYFLGEVPKVCRGGHKITETLKTTLSELLWGMDQEKISEILLKDELLARCEYCGVMSYKNSQDSPLASGDKVPVKVDNILQGSDKNVENFFPTVNLKRDDNVEKIVKLCQPVSRKSSKNHFAVGDSSRLFESSVKNGASKGALKVQKIRTDEVAEHAKSEIKSQDPNYFDPDMNLAATESLPRQPKAKNISATSIVKTVTAERKNSSLTENEKTGDASKKKQLKPSNQCARSSSVQEKNATPNDNRCRNLNSTRHSTRLVVPKTVKKTGRNIYQDNRIRSNFETLHNTWLKSRRNNCAAPRGDSEGMKSPIFKNDQTVGSRYSQNAEECENYSVKKHSSADVPLVPEKFSIGDKERNVILSDQESQQSLKSGNWLRQNHALLANGLRKRLQDRLGDSKEDQKLAGPCSASSDGKVSTDVESQLLEIENRSGDKNRRSSRSAENPKVNHIDTQINHSAPSVSLTRESPNDKDLAKAYCLGNKSSSRTRYNGESETTAFTSSSSENQLRERADDSLTKVSKIDLAYFTMKGNNGGSVEVLDECGESMRSNRHHVAPKIDCIAANLQYFLSREVTKSQDGLLKAKDNNCERFGDGYEMIDVPKKVIDRLKVRSAEFMGKAPSESRAPKETIKISYKNPIAVVSSNFEYNGDQDKFPLEGPSCNFKTGSFSRDLSDSETFERQITYDDISSRDISVGSEENLKSKLLPVYQKILENEDEMDWETFQQLVGTLHPSQRELWRDICKAVSNEAKRVAGETGASTEVCIEINPVVKNQAFNFPYGDRTPAKTSGTEVSFEMDTILNEFELFLDEKLQGAPKAS